MRSIPQNRSAQGARTLFHYGPTVRAVYDEARGVCLVPFRLSQMQQPLWPACFDCGAITRAGYVSTDGDDGVIYCPDCVKEVIES